MPSWASGSDKPCLETLGSPQGLVGAKMAPGAGLVGFGFAGVCME